MFPLQFVFFFKLMDATEEEQDASLERFHPLIFSLFSRSHHDNTKTQTPSLNRIRRDTYCTVTE